MGASQIRASRTCTVTAKVTANEERLIKAYAADRGADVSTCTRKLWLAELRRSSGAHAGRSASEQMLELFTRTMEASLELGESFTVERFRALCAEVTENGRHKHE